MIRALIIDDEPAAQSGLESILKLFCPEVKIIGFGNGVSNGITQIKELKPELVFLDIELSDGTGFDLIEQLGEINFSIIFVTAFDHYAIKALRLNAVDYLLKPVEPDELVAAVGKAKQPSKTNYTNLVKDYQQGEYKKIGVPGSRETIYLDLADIIRMESSNNYTFIHCVNTKPKLISKTIKSFETLLPEDIFIRCHQRHIVNLNHVRSYVRNEGAHLVMDGDEKIPISRANRAKVDHLLKKKFPSF
jgi:two-component system LytT family response regulator